MQTQNADLWEIEDRRAEKRTKHAAICDRKCSAPQILDGQFTFLGFLYIILYALFDLRKRQAVCIADDRHNQPFRGANRHANVVVVLEDQLLAVDLRVDLRERSEGADGGFYKEGHKAQLDAVALLELLVMSFAYIHHCAHVDLVKGRQHGSRLCGFE